MNTPPASLVKLEAKILQDLNSFLRFSVNDPRLRFVSITRVELRRDCSLAIAYWDTFDSHQHSQVAAAMAGVKGKLRTLLARGLKIKSVPELKIQHDGQFEGEQRISELIASPPQQ